MPLAWLPFQVLSFSEAHFLLQSMLTVRIHISADDECKLKSGIDFYDINRSQPVELLNGWIRFDYKPGRTKRMANRVSYNWGAPSRTTRGYHWSSDSWALYHRRGKSISEGMPRTTFGTGTSDRISDKKAK